MGTEGPQLVEPFCENDGVTGVEALNQPEKVLLGVRRNYSARARTSVTPSSCLTLHVVFLSANMLSVEVACPHSLSDISLLISARQLLPAHVMLPSSNMGD